MTDRPYYDLIADDYDGLFCDSAIKQAENREVIRLTDYQGGSVLDIGWGTGLFLEYITPTAYLGIDPSTRMLEKFHTKHYPGRWDTLPMTFEDWYWMRDGATFDLIISYFGSPSYVTPDIWDLLPTLLNPGGRYFLMFYEDHYQPETHVSTGVHPPYHPVPVNLDGDHSVLFDNYHLIQGSVE